MVNLLRRAWARLWDSGLLLVAVAWCLFGFFSYYWLSRSLAGAWQQRIYAPEHLDIGTLRLILVTASQQPLFPVLVLLFGARLCLNPIVDAYIHSRLGRSYQPLWQDFGRLYLLLYLGILLLGWLFFLSAGLLLQLITVYPLLLLFGVLFALFCFTLWLALYKARLAVEARAWPAFSIWLRVALARLLLLGGSAVVSLWLHRWAQSLSGWALLLVLCLTEVLLTGVKLWQASCAVEAAASKARWGSFSGSV